MQATLMMLTVIAANVLGASMTLPQVRQIFVSRRVAGVSAAWVGAGIAGNGWWTVYGLGVGEPAILPVSVVAVISYLAIAYGLFRFDRSSSPVAGLVLGLSMAVVPLPFVLMWGWAAAGLVLGLLYGVQLAPAVIEVFRNVNLSGVSAATWTMSCVEAALWGIYATPERDIGVMALGVVGITMSAMVLVRVTRWRRRLVDEVGLVGVTVPA